MNIESITMGAISFDAILEKGVAYWNEWRQKNRDVDINLKNFTFSARDLRGIDLSGVNLSQIDLSNANLIGARLVGANLNGANLSRTKLIKAYLTEADLVGANLSKANFSGANLNRADLRKANLGGARLIGADLSGANLTKSDLSGVNLTEANLTAANLSDVNLSDSILNSTILIKTNLSNAKLNRCNVYGISAWDVNLSNAEQHDLTITPKGESQITVDDLEVAQFIYLILNNEKIRDVIDTITSKVVLILGRFSKPRKKLLNDMKNELRKRNFTPIIFDFEKSISKDMTGTVETLARMARFVIADLTDPSCVPHELATIVPHLRTTPVLPLMLKDSNSYAMFKDFKAYKWVLKMYQYEDDDSLIDNLDKVIKPADDMAEKFRGRKRKVKS